MCAYHDESAYDTIQKHLVACYDGSEQDPPANIQELIKYINDKQLLKLFQAASKKKIHQSRHMPTRIVAEEVQRNTEAERAENYGRIDRN